MKKFIFGLAILSCGFAGVVHGANICVGPSASGNGTGSDWNNVAAWGTLSFSRANTYYLKEGTTYSGKTLNTASNGNVIAIKKATPQDHGIALNWDDSMGDSVTQFNGQIQFDSSDWLFDGKTGGGVGAWDKNFGFKIIEAGDGTAIIRIAYNAPANNITVRHVNMQGKGSVSSSGGSYSNDGFANYGGANVSLSYAWMHGIGRCPYFIRSGSNQIFEHSYVQSFFGSSGVHSEIMSTDGTMGDTTFRYNLFTDIKSTGGLMWDNGTTPSTHLYVYGNVFYKPAGAVWESANGVIGGWTGGNSEAFHNCWVFNNTFINVDQQSLSNFPNTHSGGQARNNLFYNSDAPNFECFPGHSHNHFINSGGTQGEANGTSAVNGDPFNGHASFDFTLKQNTLPGEDLSKRSGFVAEMGSDPFNRPRTSWSRGAYEFGSSTPSAQIHPADSNSDFLMALNEATSFGACWKSNCAANATLDNAVRAGTLWNATANGQYQYNLNQTCPLCWEVKP